MAHSQHGNGTHPSARPLWPGLDVMAARRRPLLNCSSRPCSSEALRLASLRSTWLDFLVACRDPTQHMNHMSEPVTYRVHMNLNNEGSCVIVSLLHPLPTTHPKGNAASGLHSIEEWMRDAPCRQHPRPSWRPSSSCRPPCRSAARRTGGKGGRRPEPHTQADTNMSDPPASNPLPSRISMHDLHGIHDD